MVGCSKKRKSQCRSPCKWVTGKGCRKGSPRRSPRRSPYLSRSASLRRTVRKQCSPDKILNPVTNRCVSRDGKIGKAILKQKMKRREKVEEKVEKHERVPYPFIEKHTNLNQKIKRSYGNEIIQIIADINRISPEQIMFVKRLGQGSFGEVFIAKINNRVVIIKFEKFGGRNSKTIQDLIQEYKTHEEFYRRKVGAPKPYFYGHVGNLFITAMKLDPFAVDFGLFEKQLKKELPTYILDYILTSIDIILAHFQKHKLIHGDFHWGNIGFQDMHSQSNTVLVEFPILVDDKSWYYVSPLIVDFGFAKIGAFYPDVELIQLIRTLHPVYLDIHHANREYLYQGLLKLVDKYGSRLGRHLFPKQPRWDENEERLMNKMFHDMRHFAFNNL